MKSWTSPIRWLLPLTACLFLPGTAWAVEPFDDPRSWDFHDEPLAVGIDHPDWFTQSFLVLREDLEEAQAEGKTGIAVYFGQRHCAYCKALMEVNFGEPDILHYTRKHFNLIAVDIWGAREVVDMDGNVLTEREYSVRENTNFTPSLIFYVGDGEEALRLRGYYPPYRFRAALEYVAEGYHRQESFRQYLTRADPPPKFDLGDLNDQPFFAAPPFMLDRSRFPAPQPLAVFFEQRDCFACDVLHTDPLSDPRVRQYLGRMEAVQLDMWSDTPVITPAGERLTAREWAEQLGLFYAPSLLLFDERGEEIIRVDSLVRLYRLQGVLEWVITRGYLEEPNYQRWRQDHRLADGLAEG